jgi:hypothetical protein
MYTCTYIYFYHNKSIQYLGVGQRGGEEAHARGGVAEGVLVAHELQLCLDVYV